MTQNTWDIWLICVPCCSICVCVCRSIFFKIFVLAPVWWCIRFSQRRITYDIHSKKVNNRINRTIAIKNECKEFNRLHSCNTTMSLAAFLSKIVSPSLLYVLKWLDFSKLCKDFARLYHKEYSWYALSHSNTCVCQS